MTTRLCSIDDCGRVHFAHGYCASHASRLRRTGSVQADVPLVSRNKQGTACNVAECDRKPHALGLCKGHHSRLKDHGDVDAARPLAPNRVTDPCSVDNCQRKHYGKGLCRLHYRRLVEYGRLDLLPPRPVVICSVPTCGRVVRYRGYCNTHAARLQRLGDVQAHIPIRSPRGGLCGVSGCERVHYCRGFCHPHYVQRVHGPKRRSLEKSAAGITTATQLEARVAYFGWTCWMCGAPWTCVDHVKPLAVGGSNWPSNLRPACRSCNASKWARWSGVALLSEVS